MTRSVHEQVLGDRYADLPTQMQAIHKIGQGHVWQGTAKVTRGANPLARLIAALMGFPPAGDRTPVTVKMEPHNGGERWTRVFGTAPSASTFNSFQTPGTGRNKGLLVERFGIISVAMTLEMRNRAMYLVPQRWNMGGIPLPKFLLPGGDSFERETDGTFWFDVTIKAPVFGLIVAYKGWLALTP